MATKPKPKPPATKKKPTAVSKIVPKSEPTARARARARDQVAQTEPTTGAGDSVRLLCRSCNRLLNPTYFPNEPIDPLADNLTGQTCWECIGADPSKVNPPKLSPEWLAEICADPKFVERCSFKEFAAIFLHGYDQAEGALECYHAMIATRLNPNAGDLIIKVNKREGEWPTFEPIIPIASLRLLAEETGLRAGETEPQWCGEDGVWLNVWPKTKLTPPHAARLGVYRQGCPQPFWGVAYFEEMAQQIWDASRKCWVTADHWLLRPASNILRCAESAAIRRAFPQLKFRTPEEQEADGNPKPVDLAPLRKSMDKIHQVASRTPAPVSTVEESDCRYTQTEPTAPHALPTGTAASPLPTGWGPARTGSPRELPLQSAPRGSVDLAVIDDPIKPLQTAAGREFSRLLVQVYEDQAAREHFLLREFLVGDATQLGITEIQKGLLMLRRQTRHPNLLAPPAGSSAVSFFEELPREGGGGGQ